GHQPANRPAGIAHHPQSRQTLVLYQLEPYSSGPCTGKRIPAAPRLHGNHGPWQGLLSIARQGYMDEVR
ncbi:hypothetical protein Dimus_021075, partial [Dionaea muscipula]